LNPKKLNTPFFGGSAYDLADSPLLNSQSGKLRIGNYRVFKELVQELFKF